MWRGLSSIFKRKFDRGIISVFSHKRDTIYNTKCNTRAKNKIVKPYEGSDVFERKFDRDQTGVSSPSLAINEIPSTIQNATQGQKIKPYIYAAHIANNLTDQPLFTNVRLPHIRPIAIIFFTLSLAVFWNHYILKSYVIKLLKWTNTWKGDGDKSQN
jgi:hypothetical protein